MPGPKLRRRYADYVRLNNVGARENGFQDAGDYKRKRYEVDDLETRVDAFMKELKPIYEEVISNRISNKISNKI